MEYFKVYFYELFFFKKMSYFFLGGRMALCKIDSKLRTKNGEKYWSKIAPGIFWYYMPCERFMLSVKIAKLMGSTNRFPKLQKLWLETNDPALLPGAHDLKRHHMINNTYYRPKK